MKVPFNDLSRIHNPLRKSFHDSLDKILDTSGFVNDTLFAEEFKNIQGLSIASHVIVVQMLSTSP